MKQGALWLALMSLGCTTPSAAPGPATLHAAQPPAAPSQPTAAVSGPAHPTFTMMNAAAIATGALSGSHGFCGNFEYQPGPCR